MRRPVLVVMAALTLIAVHADADGMLDPSFGNGGIVATDFLMGPVSYDSAMSLVVLPDGRAVAAGRAGDIIPPAAMAVGRYLSSGALDTTFSADGRVTLPPGCQIGFGGPGNGAGSVLLQPDGRLVLLGTCAHFGPPLQPVFWLARLNTDGSLDASFGAGGQVYTPYGDPSSFGVVGLLQPDGRIVAVGFRDMAVLAARYNPDGSLDPTFGTAGQATLPLADDFWVGNAALQPDGKLVIGGTYGAGSGVGDFAVLRLLPNGAADPAFDGDGLATSDFGAPETGTSVIVLGDGRLVLAGVATVLEDFALVRYLADGTLDTSFGAGGLATGNAGGEDFARQVIQLPNGKFALAGTTDAGGNRDCLLARFHADGTLDTSFGTAGFLRTDFGSTTFDSCNAIALAGPDLILTAGSVWPAGAPAYDFALARFIATTPVELLAFEVE